jgi:predicted TIM-barrel fold metal-dependent hydrolase
MSRARTCPLPAVKALACLLFLSGLRATAQPVSAQDQPPRFEDILKIDVHVHVFDDVPEFVAMLRRTNTRLVNICLGGNRPELLEPCEKRAEQFRQQYAPEFAFASTFDLTRRNEPDYARQVTSWLDASFQGGAVLVKIWKDVGMELKTTTGAYLMPDDPVFDPIYAHLAAKGRPLMAHFADPIDAWRPLDAGSAHYSYYSKHPEWHLYGKQGLPGHAEILAARDRMLSKHPDLVVIAAHLGSEAHDLDALAKRFDRFPNLYADVAARTPELRRHPAEKVRKFFMRYQDRLLYGTDADKYTEGRLPTSEERAAFVASMEKWYRNDFDYYAGQGKRKSGSREIESLGLPREVLEKFYHQNAQRLLIGLTAAPPSAPRDADK